MAFAFAADPWCKSILFYTIVVAELAGSKALTVSLVRTECVHNVPKYVRLSVPLSLDISVWRKPVHPPAFFGIVSANIALFGVISLSVWT